MTTVKNVPSQELVLQLARAKSFSVGVYLVDWSGRAIDITDVVLTLIAKKPPFDPSDTDDSDNLIVNSTATLIDPAAGYARFDLQASDLNHRPGEYPFALVMNDAGYSSVLGMGVLEIVDGPEFSSVNSTYAPNDAATALRVLMRGRHNVQITAGPALAPGTTSFTDQDKAKLDSIEWGAQQNVIGVGEDGQLIYDLDDIPDGQERFAMTAEEKEKLADLEPGAANWDDLEGKPDFGTASLLDEEEVLKPGGVSGADITSGTVGNARLPKVSQLRGFSYGTATPTGLAGGDLYLQLEE